jgi:ABC-type multidrug transport system, ATPase component
MKELIKLNRISKIFGGKTALKDITISLHEGEILGFLGPSGAGKTTTIKIITGQLIQTRGEAFVLGSNCNKINEDIYKQIGIVTDSSGIYEEFSVYENLKLFCEILGVHEARIDELLGRVGLTEQKKQLAGKLSKGQTQRLVLARSVLHKPKVLFLDEPTSGLDPSTTLEIHKLLLELKKEGMGIFLTTHNMEEATKLCKKVALLNDGLIVEYGEPQELCIRYNTDKKYKLVLDDGTILTLEQTKEDLAKMNELLFMDKVSSLHSCEPTLENVFLQVTGRELQ